MERRRSLSLEDSTSSPNQTGMSTSSPNLAVQAPLRMETTYKPGSFSSGVNTYRPKTPQRPQREPRKPPVSFRKPGSFSSTSTVFQSPGMDQESMDDAWSFADSRERTNSIASSTSQRAKDLLDAADEIKPLDFRSRVRATGARDYGEDVADRNIRQNATIRLHATLLASKHTSPVTSSRYNTATAASSRGSLGSQNQTQSPELQTSYHHHTASQPSYQRTNSEASIPLNRTEPGQSAQASTKFSNENRLSLDTYLPTGLSAPPLTSRFTVTAPGSRAGINFKYVNWPNSASAAYPPNPPLSPSRANVSMPRSPRAVQNFQQEQPSSSGLGPVEHQPNHKETQPGGGFTSRSASHQQNPSANLGHVSSRMHSRLSNQTARSSQSSSATSRYPSYDYHPLGCPRLQTSALDDFKRLYQSGQGLTKESYPNKESKGSAASITKAPPLSTPSPSRPRSSSFDDVYLCSGGKMSPTSFKDLTDDSEHEMPLLTSCIRDWELLTPCNSTSVSSASNLYSASSGRPTSRHTNATSVDSTPYWSSRKSDDSCLSANRSQNDNSTTDWSATKPMWTGFNIDDYMSSDDDFLGPSAVSRRPTAEGEEDLLFNSSFGTLGAALPGLKEVTDEESSQASRRREGPLESMISNVEDPEREIVTSTEASAAVVADIEHKRPSLTQDVPFTSPRSAPQIPGKRHRGTFGRGSKRPVVDDAIVTKDPVSDTLTEEPTHSSEPTSRRHTLRRSSSDVGLYEQNLAACRGQSRLSALGTLNGGNIDSAVSLGYLHDTTDKSSGTEEAKPRESNKVDHITALRLRKQAKALQRARNAEAFHSRRLTAAFGTAEQKGVANTTTHHEWDTIERGRSLVRKGSHNYKGKTKAS